MQKECPKHGITEYVVTGKYARCKKCRVEHVTIWRRRKKRELVVYRGGKCMLCGYSKCIEALEFHHIDPTKKEFGLSHRGFTRGITIQKREADKCVLLCANCHREVEMGLVKIPELNNL